MKSILASLTVLALAVTAFAGSYTSPQPAPDIPRGPDWLIAPILNPDDPEPIGFGRDLPSAPNPVVRPSPDEPRRALNPDDPAVRGPNIYPIPDGRYRRQTAPRINPDDAPSLDLPPGKPRPRHDGSRRDAQLEFDPTRTVGDRRGGTMDGKVIPGEILPVIRPFFQNRIAIDFGPGLMSGPVRAELYDAGGRLVLKQTTNPSAGGISDPRLGALAAGTYLLKLECDCGPRDYATQRLTKLNW